MIWVLLGGHLVAAAVMLAGARPWGRGIFAIGTLAPAATALWALGQLGNERPTTAEAVWVDGLDLTLRLRLDDLAALMTLLVSGIGALVMIYAGGYFSAGAKGLGRFGATLVVFSAAMVGLVWADSVWTLFVFWELTSVTSFLLVGHKSSDPSVLRAARRALFITAAGGLVMLGGLVVLVDEAGTARLGELGPVSGTAATVAAVAILVAAATKSAQVPFHVWLPGAMAAPTPVSAYLHSATMVKAGVLLVAVTAPAFADDVGAWKVLGVSVGFATMLWGALGALRQLDAKLILAWGTVSQLGLMIALLTMGSPKATFAAISILTAHAVFKAALFMVVGEIDVRTGTRDVSELSGLWRSMPVAAVVAVVSAASMAGVPPLLGFPAKEAAVEAVLGFDGVERLVLTGLVTVGSLLTVAYTTRFIWGTFGPGPPGAVTAVSGRRWSLAGPSVVLAAASVLGYVALGAVIDPLRRAAIEIDPGASAFTLYRWPGLTDAFVLSVAIVGTGLAVGTLASRGIGVHGAPRPLGAAGVDAGIDEVVVIARRICARVQHGSLPVYMATMAAAVGVAAVPFLADLDLDELTPWDHPTQAVLGVLVVGSAVVAARVDSRLGAALGLGAVGLAVSGTFASQGAPDLAITQLLVETVVVVGFVIALGHLTRRFPIAPPGWHGVRIAVAGVVGVGVAVAMAAASTGPTGRAPVEALTDQAVDEGGGNNVVNVILTDIRALDTLGEVVVLIVVAVGIIALAGAGRAGDSRAEAAQRST